MSCNLADRVQSTIFYSGTYEPEATVVLMNELRPGDTFLDVGANAGYFSLLASGKCRRTGMIHAFEAAPGLACQLRSDVAKLGRDFPPILVHQVAVLDHSGDVSLVESSESPGELGECYVDISGEGGRGERVPGASIDELLPNLRFDVAKIDVEGAESAVISGATKAIVRSRPRLLLVEGLDSNLARFGSSIRSLTEQMIELGYEGRDVHSKHFAPMIAFRPYAI